jgi:MFS family permease
MDRRDTSTDASPTVAAALRGRWSVAAVFLVNGFLVGSWAPQIPGFLARLGITEFTLGLLILLFGLGALSAMPWCGTLIGRFGSRRVIGMFGAVAVFGLLLIVLAPDVLLAAPALFLFGATVGGMDVAMNANAVEVERRLRRAVMSSSHGFWSLGGFAGGGLGGLVIKDSGALPHAIIVTGLALVVFLAATRGLVTETKPAIRQRFRFAPPKSPVIYLVGLMALFSMIPEGAVLDWAALYLKQELGAGIATAGLAFAAFSGAMAMMRFAGDAVRNRFGAVTTLRFSALIAATGMLVGGFAPNAWVAVLAFAFSGFGIANMVPIAFSAAGNQPGLSPGVGLSTVTVMGYSGILLAPSVIGFIGQHVGFAPAFIGVSVLLVVVFLMAGLARTADMPSQTSA